MTKRTLILLCGLPGSGKSTLAEKLEKERNAVRFWPDDWTLTLGEDTNNMQEWNRVHDIVEKLQWKTAQRLLELGNTIILENGFWPKIERDEYRDTAKKLDATVELYFLDATLETLWQRIEKRNKKLPEGSAYISYNNLLEWSKLFQPPTNEELETYDVGKVIRQN